VSAQQQASARGAAPASGAGRRRADRASDAQHRRAAQEGGVQLPARAGARSEEPIPRWERRRLGESGGGRACVVQRALPKARPREPGAGTGRSMHVEAPQAQEVEKDVGDVGGERGHQCRRAPTQNHSTNDDDGPLEPRQGHPRPGRHAHVVEEPSGRPRDVGGERGRERLPPESGRQRGRRRAASRSPRADSESRHQRRREDDSRQPLEPRQGHPRPGSHARLEERDRL